MNTIGNVLGKSSARNVFGQRKMVAFAMVVTVPTNSYASRELANSIVLCAVAEVINELLDTADVH